MSFYANKSEKTEYAPKPTGKFKARLVWLIDLGTQEIEYQGEKKFSKKVYFGFETPENTNVFKQELGEQPYMYGRDFTNSMYSQGKLRPFISGWLNKGMTDEEADEFDLETLVNKPCTIKVMSQPSKDGSKTYSNLVSVDSEEDDTKDFPKSVNEILVFQIPDNLDDKQNMTVFHKLPKWIQEKIMLSKEWIELLEIEKTTKTVLRKDEELPDIDSINVKMPF